MITYASRYRLGSQETIIIHDLHVDRLQERITEAHVELLLGLAKKHNPYFIVEDMFDYQGNDPEIQKIAPLVQDSMKKGGAVLYHGMDLIQDTILRSLTHILSERGYGVSNVEFRQHFMVNQWYAVRGIPQDALVAFNKLMATFKEALQEIEQYQDTPLLQEYYKELHQKVTRAQAYLVENGNKVLQSAAQTTLFWEKFWECMVDLLDAKIVHAWYQKSQTEPVIVVCVGAEHAMVLEALCQKLGYKQEALLGDSSMAKYVKDYRKAVNDNQLEPAVAGVGVVQNLKNFWRTCKQGWLHNRAAKQYKKVIAQSKTLSFDNF